MSIIPILVLAAGLGGCALNSLGLPGGLPVPPGGGALTISRSTVIRGVTGYDYNLNIPTTGGSGTISSCSIIAGALPAGLSIVPSGNSCKLTSGAGTITTVGRVTVNFTVQATDTASPANTASQAISMLVIPGNTITVPVSFPNARQGDDYGDSTQTCPGAIPCAAPTVATTVSNTAGSEVGNFPLFSCTFTITAGSGLATTPLPTGQTSCPLSSGVTPVGAAGVYTVSLAATDSDIFDTFAGQTANIVVHGKTITNALPSVLITPPVLASFNQNGNTVAASTLLDGENGLSYGVINANAGAPTWSVTGGLAAGAAGVGNYSWCVSAGGASVTAIGLAGISTSCAAPTAGVTSVKLTSPSAITGVASFSVDITDAGNSAVISKTVIQGTSVINAYASLGASFVQGVTSPNANPNSTLLDGVAAQSYGVINANAGAPTYTATGGLGSGVAGPTNNQWCVSAGGATVTAIGLGGISTNCGAPTTGSPVRLTTASAAVGVASYSVQLTEIGNAATPPAAAITLGTSAITVYAAAVASFNQAGNLNPASTLLAGVNLRSYGVIAAGAGAPTWTATGGLGSGSATPTNYKWCVSVGGAGVTAIGLVGISTNCAAPTTNGTGIVTLTSPSATTGVAAFTVDMTDAGNEAVPSVSIPQGTSTININAALAVALQLVPLSPDPTTPAGQAVLGRTYGAPAKTNVVYEVSGGLPAYVITPSGTLTTDTNIVCVSGATTSTCNSAGANVTNIGGVNPSLTISVTDTANAATPAAAAPATKTDVWTVNLVISFSLLPAPTGVAPNGVIPDGVVGQTYGTPLANLVFTATGGLANAAGFGLTGTQTGTLVANGILCVPTTAQVGVTVTVTCNSGGLPVTVPSGAGRTLIMTFSDVGNSTTPAGSTATDTAGFTNYSNTIAAALAIALQAGSPDPANVNAQAVVGLTYGMAPQAPVVYVATNGLPAYTFVRSGTLLANSNICAVQNVTATTLTCDSNALAVTGTTGVLTITVNDTGNATTPSSSASLTKTYTVNAVLTLTVTPDPALASSTAVVGRLYGVPAGLASPTYTAAGGLSLYAFVHSGTLEANTNIVCTDAATTVTCASGVPVTGTAPFPETEPFTLQVTDLGNLTTPADAVGVTLTKNFTINDVLLITNASLMNGLKDFTYAPTGAGAPGEILAATGGLGGNTWVAGGTVGACAPTGSLPTGLTLGAATGLLSGVPTVHSTLTSDFTFDVCVFDTANNTTPSGTGTHANYLVNVLRTDAAAAGSGTDTLEVFNTGDGSVPGFRVSIPLTAGDAPFGVAVTPNGRKAYVTANGNNVVRVVDTIDGSVTTIALGLCTGPRGVAIGMPGGVPTAFVACTNRRIAVIDASADTLVSDNQYGTGGGQFYGVALTPNETLVYVTDEANNEMVVLDALTATEIVGSPFAAGVTAPHGVAISSDGARVYIAGSGSDDVIAISTADNTTVVSTGAASISTGLGSSPESIAVTPSGTHVFVTLTGTDQFAVFNDSATPALNTVVALTAASSPFGITIPPLLAVPATGVRVFIGQFSLNNVAINDDETVTPFGVNAASPIALTALSNPRGVGHIPVPR